MRLIGAHGAVSVKRQMTKPLCALLFLSLFLAAFPLQAAAVNEAEFWRMLQRTESILDAADESQRESVLTEIRALWQGIDEVQLADEQTISIDMRWLTQSDSMLNQLEDYTESLLDYHARGGSLRDINTVDSLSILNGVLQDPRFQYAEPTPLPPIDINVDVPSPLTPEISQVILMTLGVAAVFIVLMYFARGLRLQPIAVDSVEIGEDPTTSTQAQELVKASEEAHDYRAAIRYLYLASLLLLDERGVLRYDPTLTNRELLRQVSNKSSLYDLLRVVVQTFDRVWYGFAPVDEHLYQDFRQNVEQLRVATK
jgi:hypothetical protein